MNQDPDLRGIPIIMLSGAKEVIDLPDEYSIPDRTFLPVKIFLEKPIKPDRLLAEIQAVLGARH